MSEECNLKKLKENYSTLQGRYNLPSFEKLNENFNVEKLADSETDFLLREVRSCIVDKFLNYLRFTESLINPSSSPMFVFAVIKTLGATEKEKLMELYKKIAKIEVELIELDLEYSEKKEADSIIQYYEIWQTIKKDFIEIIRVIKKNWDTKVEGDKGNYLG
jgi:hypothetical protein